MYQKFLLEIFYPSNLLEIFLGCISSWVSGVIGSSQVAPLCARIVRADYLFTADQKICTWSPLLEKSGYALPLDRLLASLEIWPSFHAVGFNGGLDDS